MEQLLEAYSISEIILFIVLLAGAVRWIVTMWDWGKDRLQKGFQKEFKQDACDQAITKQLGEISKQLNDMHIAHKQDQAKINDRIKELNSTINLYFCLCDFTYMFPFVSKILWVWRNKSHRKFKIWICWCWWEREFKSN